MDAVPTDDRGLSLGDGLFETVLADHGRLTRFDAHVARLIAGCGTLGLPAPDPEALRAQAERALARAGLGDQRAAVRLSWTAGSSGRGLDRPAAPKPRLIVSAAPAPKPEDPARLALVDIRRNERSPASRLKTLSYLDNVLARQAARAAGADEAVMLSTQGELACAAAANLFWITDERLFTPARDCGALDGIVRGAVLAAAERLGVAVVETRTGAEALSNAQAVFITNSLIGVRRASALGERALGDHPLVGALAGAV